MHKLYVFAVLAVLAMAGILAGAYKVVEERRAETQRLEDERQRQQVLLALSIWKSLTPEQQNAILKRDGK